METGALGKPYRDGDLIFRHGEQSECLYVIQEGRVESFLEEDGKEVSLTLYREGDFLGELALFFKEVHSTSARSLGDSRVLTIDKKNFIRRIQEDPTIAFRLVENLTNRVKELSEEISVLNRAVQECLEEQLRLQALKGGEES